MCVCVGVGAKGCNWVYVSGWGDGKRERGVGVRNDRPIALTIITLGLSQYNEPSRTLTGFNHGI